MTLRERLGLGGLLLVGGLAAAATFVSRPLVPAVLATDSDADGLSDPLEGALGTDPNDSTTDSDSWNDWDETFMYGTDPTSNDTDGDGVADHADSDPLVYASDAGGGSAASGTYARNLTQDAWAGTSAVDGNGVSMHSGAFRHSIRLLELDPGCGPTIPAVLYYDSGMTYDGPLGMNFDSPLNARLVVQGDGDVEYHRGDGCFLEFDQPSGPPSTPYDYTSPAEGAYLTLTKVSGTSWTLVDTHGNTKSFNGAGQITSDADRFGSALTYAYTSGMLSSVSDHAGHVLTVATHAGKARWASLTDDSSREVTLKFTASNQLSQVRLPTSTEYPSGLIHQFIAINGSDDDTLNDNIVRIIDPKGQDRRERSGPSSTSSTRAGRESPSTT